MQDWPDSWNRYSAYNQKKSLLKKFLLIPNQNFKQDFKYSENDHIIGLGTNACYLEEVKDIYTINPEDFLNQKYMIVNTEWGGFGDNGELDFIRTKWDIKVDENSINPGRQTFEKMISGMYMGELIRQVLVDLMKDDLIFFNANREKLFERGNDIYISTGPKHIPTTIQNTQQL